MTPSTFTITGLTFNSGAAAFTIVQGTPGSSGFTLTGGLNNASTHLQTIQDNIVLNTTQNFTVTAGGGNVSVTGTLSGAGGLSVVNATPAALFLEQRRLAMLLHRRNYGENGTTLTSSGTFGSTREFC